MAENVKAAARPDCRDGRPTDVSQNMSPITEQSHAWSPPDAAVAVIGMACKFPGAESLEKLWHILETGTSMCGELPDDRFPHSRFEQRKSPRNMKCNPISDIDAFDHKFFGITSREAKFMDPQQRLALQVTYQALESAGYFSCPAEDRETDTACYIAACTNEYRENVVTHPPSAFSLTGCIRPFISGKVSHYFGWTGPAIMYDAACAASGTAIHQACRSVATGECSLAVAGAVNIFVSPESFQDLARGGFISTTGQSKSFDALADGYCRGEGVAFVVLKKYSAALRDGDPIRGIIAASAVNQNANEGSITVPHGPTQAKLYRKALGLASLAPENISYVEAHGTGTPLGDPIEANSIRSVFRNTAVKTDQRKTYLGSLKSNIGHTETSSGISGLIKVILMMQKGMIPQQALFHNLNPAISPLEPDGIEISRKNVQWNIQHKATCVNNYGASGTNVVMVVTQPPESSQPLKSSLVTHFPISITAFSSSSLASYCSALLEFIALSTNSNLLRDLAFHLFLRQNASLPYSINRTVSSLPELEDLLRNTSQEPSATEKQPRPAVMFFGGQTGKSACVPRAIYNSSVVFQKHLDECDAQLQNLGAPSIFPSIFEEGLHTNIVLDHAILFSGQYASAMSWLDCGLRPTRLIGHSFGQLTALCVSGALSLEDTLRLVVKRATLIRDHWGTDTGSMIALEVEPDQAAEFMERQTHLNLEVACYNGPQSVVLAGSTTSIDSFEEWLKSSSTTMRFKRLQIQNAFHTALTDPIINPLQETAERLHIQQPRIKIETCSKQSTWPAITPSLIASHTRDPVYFHEAVTRIGEDLGPCIWLEAGFASAAPMIRRALGTTATYHEIKSLKLNPIAPLKPLADLTLELWNLNLAVRFWPFHQSQTHQFGPLNLPLYQFDKSRHWLEWKAATPLVAEVQRSVSNNVPLLQVVQVTPKGGDFKINTHHDKWQSACSENRILGVPVCPISFLMDLVFEALDKIQGLSHQQSCIYRTDYLGSLHPVPAQVENGLSLVMKIADKPQSWTFTVESNINPIHQYAFGTVSTNGAGRVADFARLERLVNVSRISEISEDTEADSMKGKTVYKSIAGLFQVTKSAQTIREVSIKGKEAAAYVTPLSRNWSDIIEYLLQVPLLCLNGLQDLPNGEMYIPSAIGQISDNPTLSLSCNKDSSYAIYLKFFESQGSELACDIFAFETQSGQLSVLLLDVVYIKVTSDGLKQALLSNEVLLPPTVEHTSGPPENTNSTQLLPKPLQRLESAVEDVETPSSQGLPDLTETLYDLFARVADVDPKRLRHDTTVADLGVDSLMMIEITEEINTTFSVDMSMTNMLPGEDIGSLCQLIAKDARGFQYSPDDNSQTEISVGDDSATSTTCDTEASSYKGYVAGDESSDEVFKALKTMNGEFDIFAERTGCGNFWSQVYPSQASLVATYIIEAFRKLGVDLSTLEAGQKIPTVPHAPKYKKLLRQLMLALRDEGLLGQVGSEWVRTSMFLPAHTPSSSEVFEKILADFPKFHIEHKLIHSVGSCLDACLSGKVDPLSLLFGSVEKRKLMADQYSVSPLFDAGSQHFASFIRKAYASRAHQQTGAASKTVRVLEVGGGTCGTSLCAARALAELELSVEYVFTDISPSFIAAAKSKLAEHDFIKYRTLDITADPPPELRDYFDMIFATNVIHATSNVGKSVVNARRMLVPGGVLALMEWTQNLYYFDLVYGVLDGWWSFEDGREHALMNEEQWREVLLRAGFSRVGWTGGDSRESESLRIILAGN